MSIIAKQFVEKLNTNDEKYLFCASYKSDGDFVKVDDTIAVFETSKAAIEIKSIRNGYIYFLSNESEKVAVGNLFAIYTDILIDNKLTLFEKMNIAVNKPSSVISQDTIFSKHALSLVETHNIDITVFSDKKLVKKSDVLEYLALSKLDHIEKIT